MTKQTMAAVLTGHFLKLLLGTAPVILEYFGGAKMGVHRYLLFIRHQYPDSLFLWPAPGAWILLGLAFAGCLVTWKLRNSAAGSRRLSAIHIVEDTALLTLVLAATGTDWLRVYKAYPFFVLALGSISLVHGAEKLLASLTLHSFIPKRRV